MRIVLIAAGAGPRFYCENCARDDALARALRARGHEVVAASLYLPSAPGPDRTAERVPVFYGAVNLYLRHRIPALASVPRWVGRLLDSPPLLAFAGALSGATDASGLEDLTLSMIRGSDPADSPELGRLLGWLASVRPDAVHLSNGLLLGIAPPIRRELGLPIVCSLQDEHTWIDELAEPARELAWRLLRDRAAAVQRFAPVSRWYARFMAERLAIPEERMSVVPIGIDADGVVAGDRAPASGPPIVGYLSHLSQRMGAGILADAFIRLAGEGRFAGIRLRFTGGSTAADAAFLGAMRRRLAKAGLLGSVDVVRTRSQRERFRFLSSLTVLSVPVPGGEAFGTFLLEAMAAGVPVVQPAAGGFTELLSDTGGGVLYDPEDPDGLRAALASLLADRARARTLGRAGRRAVRERYTTARMAAGLEAAIDRAVRSAHAER